MKKISLLLLLSLSLFSCESPLYQNFKFDYSIEQNRKCFCSNGGKWMKIYINADTVAAAYKISNNQDLTYEEFKFYKSIKGLFELINSTDTTKYELIYTIDSVKNYPTYIYLNPKPIINGDTIIVVSDAQLSFTTRNYLVND